MKKTPFISIALSLAILAMQTTAALSCAFGSDPYYTYTLHPDFPLANYARGKLGILHNTYARSYLLVAHRYLSGKTLSNEEMEGLNSLWDDRFNNTYYSTESDLKPWLTARANVPGLSKLDKIWTERPVSKENSYQTYANAQSNAFITAAATLKRLIDKYSLDSPYVKDWVKAQDQVFSNCGSESYSNKIPAVSIPEALAADADPVLKKERAYQIAAAEFYAQKFEDARKSFEAIANDKESPWQSMAGYLAVRSLIRQATLASPLNTSLLAEAGKRANELISNPAYASLKADLQELASFVAARISPEAHLNELLKEKYSMETLAEITKTIDNFIDPDNSGGQVNYASVPQSLKANEITDWVLTFQSSDDAGKKHAIEKWKSTKSTPWLLAAIAGVDARDPDAKALISAARASKSRAAYWTLFYHTLRLESDSAKDNSVGQSLDKVFAAPPADLPPGSLNELKLLRLPLSVTLDEFVKFGILKPLAICSNSAVAEMPDDEEGLKGLSKTKAMFTVEAANVINNKLPLSIIRLLAAKTTIPADLRNNLAWSGFVRAILAGNASEATEFAKIASPLNKAKSAYFADYLKATSPESKTIAAVRLMLHFSSANPNVTAGQQLDDDYGDSSGWWWGDSPLATATGPDGPDGQDAEVFEPLFITDAQKKQAAQELAKLKSAVGAPNYFAKIVLAFAKAHPQDPRVPELLHYGVKCTRYGATDSNTTALSKQMFTVLHSKYKTSPWTKKTPYWF